MKASLRKQGSRARAKATVCSVIAKSSRENSPYGRVSMHTYSLFSEQVRNVVEPVLSYLPLETTRELRDWTVKKSLETVFRDFRENGNLEALAAEDISDLGSFAELAADLAGLAESESRLQSEAVYKAVFNALLNDWLYNWNSPGISGPRQI